MPIIDTLIHRHFLSNTIETEVALFSNFTIDFCPIHYTFILVSLLFLQVKITHMAVKFANYITWYSKNGVNCHSMHQ